MSQTKRASSLKRSTKTVSVLGVAGVSLAATASGSMAEMPVPGTAPSHGPYFGEEEISDISLATFHLANPDQSESAVPGVILAHGGHGCGHGCGRGCGHGCGHGCRGCGRGCGWGCGGWGWGWGYGGCCLSWGGCRFC